MAYLGLVNAWFLIPMKKAYLLVSFVLVYIHFGVG
jgi:hypothetical protein